MNGRFVLNGRVLDAASLHVQLKLDIRGLPADGQTTAEQTVSDQPWQLGMGPDGQSFSSCSRFLAGLQAGSNAQVV